MALAQTYMPPRTDRLGLLLRGTGAGFLGARDADAETAYSLIYDFIVHPERPGNMCFNDWGSYLGELASITGAPIGRLGKDVLSLNVNESLSDIDVAIDVLNYAAVRGDEEAKQILVNDIVYGDRWHSILHFAEWIDDEVVLAAKDRMLTEPGLVTTDEDSPLGRLAASTANREVRELVGQCRVAARAEQAGYTKQHGAKEQSAIDAPIDQVLNAIDEDYARRLAKGDEEGMSVWLPGNRWYQAWRRGKRSDVDALMQEALSRGPAARLLAARVAAHAKPELLLSRLDELTEGSDVFRLRVFRLVADVDGPEAGGVLTRLATDGSVAERCVALGALAKRGDSESIQLAIELVEATDLEVCSDEFDIDLWHDMSSDLADGMLKIEHRGEARRFLAPATDIYLEACCAYERRDALEFLARWSDEDSRVLEGLYDASDTTIELAVANAGVTTASTRERLAVLREGLRSDEMAVVARDRLEVLA